MTTNKKILLAVGCVMGVAAATGLAKWWPGHQADVQADACIKNLRQLGLAGKLYAATNGNIFPADFSGLQPHLRLEFLFCPSAKASKPAAWSQFDFRQVTYEMVGAGLNQVTDYSNVFVRCPLHRFKCYGDGWTPPRYCKGQGDNE